MFEKLDFASSFYLENRMKGRHTRRRRKKWGAEIHQMCLRLKAEMCLKLQFEDQDHCPWAAAWPTAGIETACFPVGAAVLTVGGSRRFHPWSCPAGDGQPLPPAQLPHPCPLCASPASRRGPLLRGAPGPAPQEAAAAAGAAGAGCLSAGPHAFHWHRSLSHKQPLFFFVRLF